jgi:hypothetical protein
MSFTDSFQHLIQRRPPPPSPQAKTPMEGIILDVFDATATYSIPKFHPNAIFGPSPFGRSDTPPLQGDICLVVFVGSGIDKGWIVAYNSPD